MLICTITHILTININNAHVTSRRVGVGWALQEEIEVAEIYVIYYMREIGRWGVR